MARIAINPDQEIESLYLADLDRKQTEHTINPPGQDRYIHPVDRAALKAALLEIAQADSGGGAGVSDAEVDAVIAGTLGDGTGSTGGGDDLSLSNIDTVAQGDVTDITGALSADEQQAIQDALSYHLVETGNFKLSFDGGLISGAIDAGYVKVFPDDAAGLYAL